MFANAPRLAKSTSIFFLQTIPIYGNTPVQYYSNANNIEMVVILISSTLLNSTACHFVTGYYSKLSCNDGQFINDIQVIMSSVKLGKTLTYI